MFHATLVTLRGREFISGWALNGFSDLPFKSWSLNAFPIRLVCEQPVPSEGMSPPLIATIVPSVFLAHFSLAAVFMPNVSHSRLECKLHESRHESGSLTTLSLAQEQCLAYSGYSTNIY